MYLTIIHILIEIISNATELENEYSNNFYFDKKKKKIK